MQSKAIAKILTLMALFFGPMYAADTVSEEVDRLQNEVSAAQADEGFSEETLEEWVRDFEDKYQHIGVAQKGRTFFYGSATVRVGQLDPAYAKELAIAYEKAMLNLQADFILQTYGQMTAERIAEFFEDDSTNARQFPPAKLKEEASKGRLGSILDKFLNVIENKLDSELVSQGVPEDRIQKMSVTQKKLLYKDNFKKTMIKRAVQNISGLVPVQTKVITVTTPVGNSTQIGIIAVMSEKTVQFAEDITRQRPTLVRGEPREIEDILPKDGKEYLNEFGLRYVYDDQGRPMLISYGMWSVVQKTKDPSKYLRKLQSAQEKARMLAEASIGEFIKSNISASQSAEIDSISEEIAQQVTEFENGAASGSNASTDDIGETIDASFKKISSKSTFKLRGTSQVKSWKEEDENGVVYVGSVVAWSYDQLENANNIAKQKFKKDKEIVKEKKQAKKESKKSRVVNDIDDF